MKRIAFRIIPKEREWLVMTLVNGVALDKPVGRHTSRSKALHNSLRKVFKEHPGRKLFNLILEVEE